jgi:endo-1,4-beta-xylanase
VDIYFEGTDPSVDVYIDDVKVIPPDTNLVTDGGFEAGTAGWSSWNGSALSAVSTQAHSGSQSLNAANRPDAGAFAVYGLQGKVKAGTNYAFTGWTLINGTGNGVERMVFKLSCDGTGDTYNWIENNDAIVPGTWTKLSGSYSVPADCTVTDAAVYFEGTDPAFDVYVDDVSVQAQ